jgi:L-fucose isomerase-like protein
MSYKKQLCFGVIIGTRNYFNSALAKDVRKSLLESLTKAGHTYVILDESQTATGSIETREDGIKCAKLFREHRDCIDGILISLPNFGFEIGIINALDLAELKVPILVQACDDDNDKVGLDSRRDAYCGKISVCNNLYQYNIPFSLTSLHTCAIDSKEFAADLDYFTRAVQKHTATTLLTR